MHVGSPFWSWLNLKQHCQIKQKVGVVVVVVY